MTTDRQKKPGYSRYFTTLAFVAMLIVIPPVIVQMVDDTVQTLFFLALIQVFSLLALMLTVPVSIVMCVVALAKKEWKKQECYLLPDVFRLSLGALPRFLIDQDGKR